MTHTAALAQDNIRYLQQGLALLRDIDDAIYRYAAPRLFASGIGGHIRHNLDHYRSFFAGLASGRIDYDDRDRDTRIENERQQAMEQTRALIAELVELREPEVERPVLVKMDCGEQSAASDTWRSSTVGRELQFLISHTVHHYALVSVILRLQGIEVNEELGVAPSTLRYRHENLQCAPRPG